MPPLIRSRKPAPSTITGTTHDQRDKILSLMAATGGEWWTVDIRNAALQRQPASARVHNEPTPARPDPDRGEPPRERRRPNRRVGRDAPRPTRATPSASPA